MKLFVVLSFLLLVAELLIVTGQEVTYCVKPNSTATCSTEDHCDQCQTLQNYFDNIDTTINQEKNVTITFGMNGAHTVALTAEYTMILAPIVNMKGRNSIVSVMCNSYNNSNCLLLFSNNISISIQNLTIMCLQPREINYYILGNFYFVFLNQTMAIIEDFHAYKSGITINGGSLTIRGECEFAGSTYYAIVAGLSNITLSGNVTFVDNMAPYGAAVFLVLSTLTVASDANIMFINNSATNSGGAIYLYSSYLHIESGVNMTFINNSAHDSGGAIYIGPDQTGISNNYLILMALMSVVPMDSQFYSPKCDNASVHFSFDNNSAAAGDDIYGASLEAWFYIKISSCYSFTFSSNISSITSDPLRVCLCDSHGAPQCTNTNISRQVYPGERFSVPLVIVGYDLRPSIGVIYANLLHNNNLINTKLDPASQNGCVISNGEQCTDLSFSLFSNEISQTVTMYITPENTTQMALSYMNTSCYLAHDSLCIHLMPVIVEITILPCPPGFLLRNNRCDCYQVVETESCSIINGFGYFSWNTTAWISIENNTLLYSSPCPLDYCNITGKDINLQDDSDSQCASNRAGRLCGRCKDNYSLAIGSSHCVHCPNNNNLALLIFFAAAGFLLVFFISAFNLTVTQGMINGLIFYANIVWTYQSIFFPQELVSNPALVFLRIFVAWVNLEFGIETCFVNGLDAFWKTWLQFIFPFYIIAIAGLIIVAAKYSTRLTKLLGTRSVPVLNTLFLLSYMKLLRTAVSIMDVSIVYEYPNNSKLYVWSYDGNLPYCRVPHIYLFLVGLIMLIIGIFFTLVLLLMQWLRKGSHLLFLKWITKFNPVFDACFAPLKHKHQYWFGVLLLARVILYVVFAFSHSLPQGVNINLLLLQISMIVLLCYMTLAQPYKNWTILLLQSTFLSNIAVLSGFFLFTQTRPSHAKPTLFAIMLSTIITIAFAQFCCIVFYETCMLIKKKCKLTRCYNNIASPDGIYFSISYHRDPVIHSGEEQPLMDLSNSSNQPTY